MDHDYFEAALLGSVLGVQVLAAVSVAVARICCRSSANLLFQAIFFVSLVVVGAAAMFAVAWGGGLWLAAAVTLPLMAVGATIDLRGGPIRTF